MPLRCLLIIGVFLTSAKSDGIAQDAHPILSEFVAIRQQNGILLQWTIRGGNQCEGTRVYRAKDDEVFELIQHISGICGGTDFDETYTHLDTLPAKNVENHYKLEMGDLGFTETVSMVYVHFGQSDHARLTDAANGTITLMVNNAQQETLTLVLFEKGGKVMQTRHTNESALLINTDALEGGVYVYRIQGSALGSITGRFVVIR